SYHASRTGAGPAAGSPPGERCCRNPARGVSIYVRWKRPVGGERLPKHILVVDDEANVRRIVQVILQKAGHRVTMAADGVEGLEKVREDRPDLVLLDVMMPRTDGFEMLRRLKADPEPAAVCVVRPTAR